MRKEKKQAVGLALLALASAPVLAFQPLITDDTGTQGAGGNQLEFSLNRDRQKVDGATTRTQTLPFFFTRGLSETVDLYASLSQIRIRSTTPGSDASGGGNPLFGAKWRFYENAASKTSFALKPEFTLPVSAAKEAAGLGNGKLSYALTGIVTQEVPFGAVHANLGLRRDRFDDVSANPQATTLHFSMAPVWDVTEQWKLALDLGTDRKRAAGKRINSFATELGAIYSPSKDLDLALGLIRQHDTASPKTTTLSLTAGVTWRFK